MDLQRTRIVGKADSELIRGREARRVVEVAEVHLDHRLVRPSAGGDVGLELPGVWILAMDLKRLSRSVEHHASGTIANGRSNSIEGFEKVGL